VLLTAEQYRRGVVRWDGETEVVVTISSADGSQQSGVMNDKRGSIPDYVPETDGEVKVLPNRQDVVTPPFRFVWDREIQGDIEARVFDTELGVGHLRGMTGPEDSERIVLSVPYLRWNEPWVIRVGDVAIRFLDEMPIDMTTQEGWVSEENHAAFSQRFGPHLVQGPLIDIVAPRTIGKAHEITYAILALIALVVGDAAIGEVIHVDAMTMAHGLAGHEAQLLFRPITSAPNQTLRLPITVDEVWLQEINARVTRLMGRPELQEDTLIALRWLERALRKTDDVDRYTAAVSGLESLIARRAKRHGVEVEFARILRDPRVAEYLAPLRKEYPDDHVDRLLERLLNTMPSAQDRFKSVAEQLRLEQDATTEFREVNRQRGPVVHGSEGRVDHELMDKAVRLLTAMLFSVLRVERVESDLSTGN
jgi:hypothetical protein